MTAPHLARPLRARPGRTPSLVAVVAAGALAACGAPAPQDPTLARHLMQAQAVGARTRTRVVSAEERTGVARAVGVGERAGRAVPLVRVTRPRPASPTIARAARTVGVTAVVPAAPAPSVVPLPTVTPVVRPAEGPPAASHGATAADAAEASGSGPAPAADAPRITPPTVALPQVPGTGTAGDSCVVSPTGRIGDVIKGIPAAPGPRTGDGREGRRGRLGGFGGGGRRPF